eukprot:scaffold5262_cov14-Tisochrysis_lutea.AAC.1
MEKHEHAAAAFLRLNEELPDQKPVGLAHFLKYLSCRRACCAALPVPCRPWPHQQPGLRVQK